MHEGARSRLQAGTGGQDLANDNQSSGKEKLANVRVRQRAIGRELRRLYDEAAQEPVPEEFLDLLRKMDDNGNKPKG